MLRPSHMHVDEDSSWKCWDGGKKQNRGRSDGWRRSLLISQLCLHPPGLFIYSAALCPLSSFHCSPVEEDLTAAVYTSQDSPTTVVSFKFKDNWHIISSRRLMRFRNFHLSVSLSYTKPRQPHPHPETCGGSPTLRLCRPDSLARLPCSVSGWKIQSQPPRSARRQSGPGRVDLDQTCLISRIESPDCAVTQVGEGGNGAWEGTTMTTSQSLVVRVHWTLYSHNIATLL